MRSAWGWALGAGVLVASIGTGPASACENVVILDVNDAARLVASAERSLAEGRAQLALRRASRAHSILRREQRAATGRDRVRVERLRSVLDRVLAVAIVRLDGRADPNRLRYRPDADASARRAALQQAVAILERQRNARRDDPVLTARYAEALAALDARREDARRLLVELEEGDLMPDADAYRVLAHLSDRAGDRARRDAAVDACQRRAGDRARYVCPRIVVVRR
jgi:hypothetical protein